MRKRTIDVGETRESENDSQTLFELITLIFLGYIDTIATGMLTPGLCVRPN